MLENLAAAYLTLAPLAVTLALGAVAAAWFTGGRLVHVRVRARDDRRRPR
jgi:hypothetical protein